MGKEVGKPRKEEVGKQPLNGAGKLYATLHRLLHIPRYYVGAHARAHPHARTHAPSTFSSHHYHQKIPFCKSTGKSSKVEVVVMNPARGVCWVRYSIGKLRRFVALGAIHAGS